VSNNIHSTAIIGDNVKIGKNVEIGPFAIIGDNVKIGDETKIKSNVKINSYVELGKNNIIHPYAYLGGPPQDVKYNGEKTWVKIGNNNIIREYVTVHRSSKENESTVVGDENFLMAYSHLAHDCRVGNRNTIVNYAGISGHVEIEDDTFISGSTLVHQFVKIGKMTMIGGGSKITQDVLPFTLVDGNPCNVYGLNIVGLRRNRVSKETRNALKRALRVALDKKRKKKIISELKQMKIYDFEEVKHFVNFVQKS
jgi:UDP-N-acetylglucosamine acyltransferase